MIRTIEEKPPSLDPGLEIQVGRDTALERLLRDLEPAPAPPATASRPAVRREPYTYD